MLLHKEIIQNRYTVKKQNNAYSLLYSKKHAPDLENALDFTSSLYLTLIFSIHKRSPAKSSQRFLSSAEPSFSFQQRDGVSNKLQQLLNVVISTLSLLTNSSKFWFFSRLVLVWV